MGPGPVFFIAVVMGGATLITYTVFNFLYKIQKAKAEARPSGLNERLSRQMDKLVAANASLQRRVEILESLVADADLEQLQTGLDSSDPVSEKQSTTTIEVKLDEDRAF
jgi:hypothetical protein